MTTTHDVRNMVNIILVVAVAVLLAAWWRQRAELRDAMAANERLSQAGAVRPAEPDRGSTEPVAPGAPLPAPALPSVAEPSAPSLPAPAPAEPQVLTPAGMAPAPRSSGLALAGTRVAPAGNGTQVTMSFTAASTEPLGLVAIVVRVPRDYPGRIRDLGPADATAYADAMKRVSDDGRFAVFQGRAGQVAGVEFALTVSGATVADVRGTCGIGPFDLSIAPDKAAASPK